MIVNLKSRTIRRTGVKYPYLILPEEFMENYDVKIGDEVELFLDTDRPNELVIRKK